MSNTTVIELHSVKSHSASFVSATFQRPPLDYIAPSPNIKISAEISSPSANSLMINPPPAIIKESTRCHVSSQILSLWSQIENLLAF